MGIFKSLVIEICELHGQGLDAPKIARILNMSVSDVGYVINEYYKEFAGEAVYYVSNEYYKEFAQ